jgi:hypothetical protein
VSRLADPEVAAITERVRAICLAFEGASEKLSHGEPAFFVHGRQFANMDTYHHSSAHLAAWFAAPAGAQEALIAARPERFFRPPYVGHRGWVGLRLDGEVDWDEVAFVASEAVAAITAARAGRSAARH